MRIVASGSAADSVNLCTFNLQNYHTLYGEACSAWCTILHCVCTRCMHQMYAPDVCISEHACFMSSNAVVVASPVCTFNKTMMLQRQQGLSTISAVPSCVKLCS